MQDSIEIDGIALESKWIGPFPADAPTIVMMHEGLGSVSTWRDFPERLAKATNAGVFVYSRAGYGRSSPVKPPRPVDYLRREALEVVPKLLDKIGFERGILLGHSDGGSIAAIYAGSIQDHRVRGLILIEPHFFVEEMNLKAIQKITDDYKTSDLGSRLGRHHNNPDDTFYGWSGFWLDPRFKSFDMRADLQHIRVPILIVKGENDPYGSIEQIRVAEQECYCPVESIVIEGARHAPHQEKPEEAMGAIASFVNHVLWSHQEARPLKTASGR